MSVEDRWAVDVWNGCQRLHDGRCTMDISFKDQNLKLDNNQVMAEKRVESLHHHLN